MNTQIFGKRVYDNGNGEYMTEYELWFINRWGFAPYDWAQGLNGVRNVEEMVSMRNECKDYGIEPDEKTLVLTEEEWEAWKQSKNNEAAR